MTSMKAAIGVLALWVGCAPSARVGSGGAGGEGPAGTGGGAGRGPAGTGGAAGQAGGGGRSMDAGVSADAPAAGRDARPGEMPPGQPVPLPLVVTDHFPNVGWFGDGAVMAHFM